MTVTTAHSAPAIDQETPIRLGTAAELGFPDGSMTVSGLRKERAAGRLETWMIAGKEYTSLGAIDEMVKQCRELARAKRAVSQPAPYVGMLDPDRGGELALAACLARCQPPNKASDGRRKK